METAKWLILPAFAFAGFVLEGQTKLPAPAGSFSVGRSAFFWTMQSKPWELAAFFYYPAKANGEKAGYFPGLSGLPASPNTRVLQLQFGSAWQTVAAGTIRSNAYTDAPFVGGREKFPVLIFSPGLGAPSLAYSVQLEELASHGYVVVALEHGTDAPLIIKPDHTLVPFVSRALGDGPPTASGLETDLEVVRLWTADTSFALNQIVQLTRHRGTKFFHRLNLSAIGVFGHSAGGKAAARVCQNDSRIRACLNQDGEMFGIPFGGTESIPSVVANQPTKGPLVDIYVAEPGVNDAQLAAVHVTRKQYEDWRAAKTAALRNFLKANSRQSYLITIQRPGFVHGSFMDIRLLRAAIDGKSAPEDASNLNLGIAFTQAFFDRTLKNESTAWNKLLASPPEGVTIDSLGTQH